MRQFSKSDHVRLQKTSRNGCAFISMYVIYENPLLRNFVNVLRSIELWIPIEKTFFRTVKPLRFEPFKKLEIIISNRHITL